jgi:hypothetical protein
MPVQPREILLHAFLCTKSGNKNTLPFAAYLILENTTSFYLLRKIFLLHYWSPILLRQFFAYFIRGNTTIFFDGTIGKYSYFVVLQAMLLPYFSRENTTTPFISSFTLGKYYCLSLLPFTTV